MKKTLYILLLLISSFSVSAQQSNSRTLKGLKKVNCDDVNKKSSDKKQLQCLGLDVLNDGVNYFPEFTRTYSKAITSPEMSWEAVKELYPDNEFSCWTEYGGYYVFSFDCGLALNKNKCSFLCIVYVPKGGNEFWWYVPRT